MVRSQKIFVREYVFTPSKLLNNLKNTEFKILKIIPGVVAEFVNCKCTPGTHFVRA